MKPGEKYIFLTLIYSLLIVRKSDMCPYKFRHNTKLTEVSLCLSGLQFFRTVLNCLIKNISQK